MRKAGILPEDIEVYVEMNILPAVYSQCGAYVQQWESCMRSDLPGGSRRLLQRKEQESLEMLSQISGITERALMRLILWEHLFRNGKFRRSLNFRRIPQCFALIRGEMSKGLKIVKPTWEDEKSGKVSHRWLHKVSPEQFYFGGDDPDHNRIKKFWEQKVHKTMRWRSCNRKNHRKENSGKYTQSRKGQWSRWVRACGWRKFWLIAGGRQ